MRIAIRVDASVELGMGHLKRCLALADALRSVGADALFVTRDSELNVSQVIQRHGNYAVRYLPAPKELSSGEVQASTRLARNVVSWQQDACETVEQLRSIDCAWLLVDSYALDARWHGHVRQELGVRIAAIDDLADRSLAVDLLIDHNLATDHTEKYRGRLEYRSRMLCGPRFALLGKGFANAARYRFRDQVKSIGVFMGGTDSAGLTSVVIDACRRVARFEGHLEIGTTSGNPALPGLKARCGAEQNMSLCVDQPDLATFFSRHDLQVGAGGGAAWERCCVGVPSITLVTAENQLAVVPMLGNTGASAVLPDGCAPDAEAIGVLVRTMLNDSGARLAMHEQSLRFVDGRGAQRVALSLAASELQVRAAAMHDVELVYQWRNHVETRSISRDRSPIPWSVHQAWFCNVLADSRRRMLIGVVGDTPVGVLRFDSRVGRDEVEVSIFLDPGLHGLGLGAALMRVGHADWEHTVGRDSSFVATVLDGNLVSKRLFESAGYEFQNPIWRRRRAV